MRSELAFLLTGVTCAVCAGRPVPAAETVSSAAILRTYGDVAEAMYSDALSGAVNLRSAVKALLDKPSTETMEAARTAWKAARVPYMQTEGFRFGNKIVDDWEGRVNSWPLDEGLIDYVDLKSYGESSEANPLYRVNIIANKEIQVGADKVDATTIDKKFLQKLHQALGVEANVATGYHAIEFLLWGQDLNGTGPGAGNRPATDYDLAKCSNGNCDRRGAYLLAATELLVDDLNEMADDWKEAGPARRELAAKGPDAGLTTIFTGLGSLSFGELAGERIKLGLLLHDPEEEQDCFSDNTHNSHYYDQIGIIEIWNGHYMRTDGTTLEGPSVAAFARERAPEAAKQVDDAFAASLAKLQIIKAKADSGEMAYDQMLAEGNTVGNKMLADAAEAVSDQARALERVVAALKLKIELGESKGLAKLDKDGAK
jgi:putative iron-regulated protein